MMFSGPRSKFTVAQGTPHGLPIWDPTVPVWREGFLQHARSRRSLDSVEELRRRINELKSFPCVPRPILPPPEKNFFAAFRCGGWLERNVIQIITFCIFKELHRVL